MCSTFTVFIVSPLHQTLTVDLNTGRYFCDPVWILWNLSCGISIEGKMQLLKVSSRNDMLLLTNCEVHTGKYSDRSFDVRTEQSEYEKRKFRVFSLMDRANWSIRDFLYSQNQHQ